MVLVQPAGRSRRKTDRRDASLLSEQLWLNRHRLLAGQSVHGLRRVTFPNERDAQDRQLTALRQRLVQWRTKTINKVQHLLLKHNLQQECPTKGIKSKRARQWLAELALTEVDRLELDLLLGQWAVWDEQLAAIEMRIAERQPAHPLAPLVATIPGAGASGSLALASRMGPIERFPTAGSLANYWGLTPACRNSGEATDRLGSITKQGSSLARFQLSQMVMHVLQQRPVDEELVSSHQGPPRSEDRAGGRHAAIGHDPLADGKTPRTVCCGRVTPRRLNRQPQENVST